MAKRQSMQHVIHEHVSEIIRLSSDSPIDEIELIRDGHHIVVNAYRLLWLGNLGDHAQLVGIAFDQAPKLPDGWDTPKELPAKKIRSLWRRSCELIPGLNFLRGVPAGGFVEWLWSFTQHLLRGTTGIVEMAFAIDPYALWIGAITSQGKVTSHLRLSPGYSTATVPADPNLATGDDLQTISTLSASLSQSRSVIAQLNESSTYVTNSLREVQKTEPTHPDFGMIKGHADNAVRKHRVVWREVRYIAVTDALVRSYVAQLLPAEFAIEVPKLGDESYSRCMQLASVEFTKLAVKTKSAILTSERFARPMNSTINNRGRKSEQGRKTDPRFNEIVREWQSGRYRTYKDLVHGMSLSKWGNLSALKRAERAIDANRKREKRRRTKTTVKR